MFSATPSAWLAVLPALIPILGTGFADVTTPLIPSLGLCDHSSDGRCQRWQTVQIIENSGERFCDKVQSQGAAQGVSREAPSTEKEQLERSAEMFEMILQTAPDDTQNYLALKEIYRQLGRGGDFKRIVKGLAGVYLNSGQRHQAAREYADALEFDPTDEEVANKLREIGYDSADLPLLKAEAGLKEVRREYEQKLKELQEAERAFAKATEKAADLREGQGEESRRALRAIEEETERKTQHLIEEHQQWLREGHTEVFKRVAQNLKKEADRIIETDQYGKISKSVKEAERLLASTDKVFQQEWRRVREEREREFRDEFEALNQEKDGEFPSAWQEIVASAERDQAAADRALKEVKGELKKLERELSEKEKLLKGNNRANSGPDSSNVFLKDDRSPPGRAVASSSAPESIELPEEDITDSAIPRTARDDAGKALGAILLQDGLVTPQQLEEAIARQEKDNRPVGEILVESGYAAEEDIINALVGQAGVPYLPLANYEISEEATMAIPKDLALKYSLMPVDKIGGSLLVAMGIPLSPEQKREVQRHVLGMKVTYFISSWSEIKARFEQQYG